MTHAERASIKRQMSIGEHRGENDLNRAWSVATYVHVNGEKYQVTGGDGQFCTWVPGGAVCEESLEKLRDKVIAALAGKPKAATNHGDLVMIAANAITGKCKTDTARCVMDMVDWIKQRRSFRATFPPSAPQSSVRASVDLSPLAALIEMRNQRRNEMFRRMAELTNAISGKPPK